MLSESLNHFKLQLSQKFLIEPADNNYLLARFTKIHGLHQEFFWQAQQCLEKYFKGILIVNEKSVKTQGHNLGKLYTCYVEVCGNLAILNFVKPEGLSAGLWTDESVSSYIKRINKFGNTDSRYGLTSWSSRSCDLFKLDQLVLALRRVSIGLKWKLGHDFSIENDDNYKDVLPYKGQCFKNVLLAHPSFYPRRIEGMVKCNNIITTETTLDILHAWNFEINRTDEDLNKSAPNSISSAIGSMQNSFLYLFQEDLLRDRYVKEPHLLLDEEPYLLDGLDWLISKVKIESESKNWFNAKISEYKRVLNE